MFQDKRFIGLIIVLLLFAAACGKKVSEEAVSKKAAVGDFSAPLRLSALNTDAAEPAIASTHDGTVYVVWVEHGDKKQSNVLLSVLDQNGNAQSQPVRVNPRGGEATAWRGDPPSIAIAMDGTIYVGWTGRTASEGLGTDLFLSVSRDRGRSFEQPLKVNDDKEPVVHGMHSLAVDGNGRVFLVWLDERSVKMEMSGEKGKMDEHKMEANREIYAASSTDGGRTISQNRLVAREACPCCKTAITTGADGRIYVAWRQVLPGNYRHIAVASSMDGGQTFSEPVIASDDKWMIAGCPVSGPALVVTADNALRALWYSGGDAGSHGLYWSESRDGAKTFSSRKPLIEGPAFGTPRLISGPGSNTVIAVWESSQKGESKIVVAKLDNAGAPTVTEIPSQGQLPTAAATRDQLFITYITKQNEQRSIWLVRAKAIA